MHILKENRITSIFQDFNFTLVSGSKNERARKGATAGINEYQYRFRKKPLNNPSLGPACPVPTPEAIARVHPRTPHSWWFLLYPGANQSASRRSRGSPHRSLFKVERPAVARVHLWSAPCPLAPRRRPLPETPLIRESVSHRRQC